MYSKDSLSPIAYDRRDSKAGLGNVKNKIKKDNVNGDISDILAV